MITTFSGIGNILKAGRLFKALKTASSLVFKAKVIKVAAGSVRAFSGIIEISSGAGNGLIKLMGKQDSEKGRAISEVLFYLEMLSLGAELTVAISNGLKGASKKAIDDTTVKKAYDEANNGTGKSADDAEVIEAYEFLDETSKIRTKIDDGINKGSGNAKKIKNVPLNSIVSVLRNITVQSTVVARALKRKRIIVHILGDAEFAKLYGPAKKGDKIENIKAFEYEGEIFLRETSTVDELPGLLAHEGTHALDNLDVLINDPDKLKKLTGEIVHEGEEMSKYIDGLNFDQLIEFRGRIYEREVQIALNQTLDFENINDLIKYIKKEY